MNTYDELSNMPAVLLRLGKLIKAASARNEIQLLDELYSQKEILEARWLYLKRQEALRQYTK